MRNFTGVKNLIIYYSFLSWDQVSYPFKNYRYRNNNFVCFKFYFYLIDLKTKIISIEIVIFYALNFMFLENREKNYRYRNSNFLCFKFYISRKYTWKNKIINTEIVIFHVLNFMFLEITLEKNYGYRNSNFLCFEFYISRK
jgi:hypothetical protein